jgi:D-tyrosyl-tRNA(Tyr) deacylase
MIAVIQRVTEASVTVGNETVGQIGPGLVALVAVTKDDTNADLKWMARKLTELRTFRNNDKHFDLDVRSAGGSILLVSNFTLAGATLQGRRPAFDTAADAEKGAADFATLVQLVRDTGVPVQTGRFRADMSVNIINDGPVTLILDSREARVPDRRRV